jgi:hypothetical protein
MAFLHGEGTSLDGSFGTDRLVVYFRRAIRGMGKANLDGVQALAQDDPSRNRMSLNHGAYRQFARADRTRGGRGHS